MSRAGWLSGVFNAVKLLYSFSISGPSSTLNPISEKIDEISSMTWDTGWIFPWTKGLSGKVISIFSFSNFWLISFVSILLIFVVIKFWSSSFTEFKSDANFFLSCSATFPSSLNLELINPFFPNRSALIWLTWFKSKFSCNFKRNSSFIFNIGHIERLFLHRRKTIVKINLVPIELFERSF